MDRGAPASAQAAGRQRADLAGHGFHRYHRRRPQPPDRLSRRSLRGILLPDERRRLSQYHGERQARASRAQGRRDLPYAPAPSSLAPPPPPRPPLPRDPPHPPAVRNDRL